MFFFLFCFSLSKTVTWPELELRKKKDIYTNYSSLYKWTQQGECNIQGSGECDPGKQADFDIDGTYRRFNFYRYLAGLKPAIKSTDSKLIDEEMRASMVLSKMGQLTHQIPSSAPCYSEAARSGAANSNIFMVGGRSACATNSIDAYIVDNGTPSLGHRRWILYPHNHEVISGVYGKASAIRVMGFTNAYDEKELPIFIAYPSSGYFPSRLMVRDWSFSGIMSNKYGGTNWMPSDSQAKIVCDGKNIPITQEIDKQNSVMYPGFVKMSITNNADIPKAGQKCTVTISSKSQDTTWTYNVWPFDIDTYDPATDPDEPKPTPKPTPDPKLMSTYCIGTEASCGSNYVSNNNIESFLENTKVSKVTIEIKQNTANIPLNQFLTHDIDLRGITATNPTVTFQKNGNPKEGTIQNIENIVFKTSEKEISFIELSVFKSSFGSAIALSSNSLSTDFDTIYSLLSKGGASIKSKTLKINLDFQATISFVTETKIKITKKSATSKLLVDESITIDDSGASDLEIATNEPVVLKVDDTNPTKKIKKVKIDVSESSTKVVEFEGKWNDVENSKESLSVDSGNAPVVSKGNEVPDFSNSFTRPNDPANKVQPGVIAAIVIIIIVIIAVIVFTVAVIKKKSKKESSSSKKGKDV